MLTACQILRVIAAELDDAHGKTPVPAGQHTLAGKLSLSYSGSLEQLPMQSIRATPRVPLEIVLALVSERGGIKADQLTALLLAAAIDAAGDQEPTSAYIEHTKKSLRQVKDTLAEKLPRIDRNGPLRRILTLSRVKVTQA